MTDTKEIASQPETPVNLTPEKVKGEILLALTVAEQSIQLLHTAKSKLVFNEDNLAEQKKFLDDCKAAGKTVEAERAKKKKPHWDNGVAVDAGAKLLSNELDGLYKDVYAKYAPLCAEAERKKKEADDEQLRVDTIREQMSTFKTETATKVAAAETFAEIVALERLLNLETANKTRYQEFVDEFRNDVQDISSLIKQKKIAARQREGLGIEGQDGSENRSDEQILADMDKKEGLDTKIAELNTKIVEKAVNQSSRPTGGGLTQIFASVPKGGRKLWKYIVIDMKAAEKAGLTLTVINEAKVKEIMAKKREDGTEITENGIRYYQEKSY